MEDKNPTYNKTNIIIGIVLAVAVLGIIVLSVISYVNTTVDKNDIFELQVQVANLQSKICSYFVVYNLIYDCIFYEYY